VLGYGDLVDMASGRTSAKWTLSSTCGGVLTPELADRSAANVLNLKVDNLWTCEMNRGCIREMLVLPEEIQPNRVFRNQSEFINPDVWEKLQSIDLNKAEERAALIMNSASRGVAYCVKARSLCPVQRADLHIGGTPCVHDSKFGKREKGNGRHAWVTISFLRQRRDLREPYFIVENVGEQGDALHKRYLADLYEIERVLLCPSKQGWKSKRKQQYVVGKLLALNISIPRLFADLSMPFTDFISNIFSRQCNYNYDAYCISITEEIEVDLNWARNRTATIKRHELPPEEGNPWHDPIGSWEHASNLSERNRLELYRKTFPNCAWDLGQDMAFCLRSGIEEPLHTLVKGQGITWNTGLNPERWFTPQECFIAMGFPVRLVQAASMGVACQFTDGFTHNSRSRSSMLHQSGNAMHSNSIGSVIMSIFLLDPSVPKRADPDLNSEMVTLARPLVPPPALTLKVKRCGGALHDNDDDDPDFVAVYLKRVSARARHR